MRPEFLTRNRLDSWNRLYHTLQSQSNTPIKGQPAAEELWQTAHRSSPTTHFPGTLEEQEAALATNPLMQRLIESRATYADDPHRPAYHYVNPEAMLNDPNGLCYWQGHWHLFYQAYPPEDTRQHWGHAISKDLVHWRDLPYCIYPDPEDKCFSGAALVEENRVIAMYHGTEAGNMVAISDDPLLLNWTKVGDRAVIPMPEPDSNAPYRVFDPCIWKKDGRYYSLSAGTKPEGPAGKPVRANFLFKSEDLEHWTYLHPFVEDDAFTLVGDDGACPYFWPIGDASTPSAATVLECPFALREPPAASTRSTPGR